MKKDTPNEKPKKVAKKVASKKTAPKKVASRKVKLRAITRKERALTDKQKAMLKFISKVKKTFTLRVAGESIGHKDNPFASIYAYSVIKSLVNKGLVKKTKISERKSTYSVV